MTAPPDPAGTSDPPARTGGRMFSVAAIALGLAAILLYPLVLGGVGLVLALVALRRGEPLARTAVIAAVAGTVIGVLLGLIVVSTAG